MCPTHPPIVPARLMMLQFLSPFPLWNPASTMESGKSNFNTQQRKKERKNKKQINELRKKEGKKERGEGEREARRKEGRKGGMKKEKKGGKYGCKI